MRDRPVGGSSLSLSFSLSLPLVFSLSRTNTHTLSSSLSHARTLSLTHTHSLSLSLPLSFARALWHALSEHSLAHSFTPTHTLRAGTNLLEAESMAPSSSLSPHAVAPARSRIAQRGIQEKERPPKIRWIVWINCSQDLGEVSAAIYPADLPLISSE